MIYSVSRDTQLTFLPGEVSMLLPRGWSRNDSIIKLPEIQATFTILHQIGGTVLNRLRSVPLNGVPVLGGEVIKLTDPDLQRKVPEALEILALRAFDTARPRASHWPYNDLKRLSGPTELARATKLYEGLHEIVKDSGLVHVIYCPYLSQDNQERGQ